LTSAEFNGPASIKFLFSPRGFEVEVGGAQMRRRRRNQGNNSGAIRLTTPGNYLRPTRF
jgi:hypothetical protein